MSSISLRAFQYPSFELVEAQKSLESDSECTQSKWKVKDCLRLGGSSMQQDKHLDLAIQLPLWDDLDVVDDCSKQFKGYSEGSKFGESSDFVLCVALTGYINYSVVQVLHMAGYHSIFDIADDNPLRVSMLPFIGAKTFRQIERCLNDHGLSFDYSKSGPITYTGDLGSNEPTFK